MDIKKILEKRKYTKDYKESCIFLFLLHITYVMLNIPEKYPNIPDPIEYIFFAGSLVCFVILIFMAISIVIETIIKRIIKANWENIKKFPSCEKSYNNKFFWIYDILYIYLIFSAPILYFFLIKH